MLQLNPVSLSIIVGRINNERGYVNLKIPQFSGTEYSLCPVHMLLLQYLCAIIHQWESPLSYGYLLSGFQRQN